jgi:uncharacterized protein involved in propanediol utilization
MMFESKILTGYGKSHASFGELLQGRLTDNRDFLVTLPIDLWSICNLTAVIRPGPLVINCEYFKSKRVAEMLLEKLGIKDNYEITISFSRNIPVGKGLSSSTADMLSTIRALQEIFGFLLREKTISEIFIAIEPHDGLMFKSCVVYDHRKGELIKELLYIPEYWVIAIDFGGTVDTLTYNQNLKFTNEITHQYEALLQRLEIAFGNKNDEEIARCASESTEIHLELNNSSERLRVASESKRFEPLGIVNTHSGTCLGLLFSRTIEKSEILKIAAEVNNHFQYPVFLTSTLKLLI